MSRRCTACSRWAASCIVTKTTKQKEPSFDWPKIAFVDREVAAIISSWDDVKWTSSVTRFYVTICTFLKCLLCLFSTGVLMVCATNMRLPINWRFIMPDPYLASPPEPINYSRWINFHSPNRSHKFTFFQHKSQSLFLLLVWCEQCIQFNLIESENCEKLSERGKRVFCR